MSATDCSLCREDGGALVLKNELLRVVLIDEPDYPGFARVIVNAHVREMTDLDASALARVMAAVYAVEDALRAVLAPDKINLASLGNVVPHLHWHVIPRFADDTHFPQAIWGARQRDPDSTKLAARRAQLPKLAEEIRARIGQR
ncbi:HIT family protein [Betaproteobacteria bacterium PRO7]|nr:HIT family protein [Burkholderiaceae bacterium]MDL1860707.1 HIT family protein [Betaproteobacteria bacterium PRO7]GIL05814.1 MAG: HIT family protein [Betaproteobacteria bacterium]